MKNYFVTPAAKETREYVGITLKVGRKLKAIAEKERGGIYMYVYTYIYILFVCSLLVKIVREMMDRFLEVSIYFSSVHFHKIQSFRKEIMVWTFSLDVLSRANYILYIH